MEEPNSIKINDNILKEIEDAKADDNVKKFLLQVFELELFHCRNEKGNYKHGKHLDSLIQDFAAKMEKNK